jgi:hypothetical protein
MHLTERHALQHADLSAGRGIQGFDTIKAGRAVGIEIHPIMWVLP